MVQVLATTRPCKKTQRREVQQDVAQACCHGSVITTLSACDCGYVSYLYWETFRGVRLHHHRYPLSEELRTRAPLRLPAIDAEGVERIGCDSADDALLCFAHRCEGGGRPRRSRSAAAPVSAKDFASTSLEGKSWNHSVSGIIPNRLSSAGHGSKSVLPLVPTPQCTKRFMVCYNELRQRLALRYFTP